MPPALLDYATEEDYRQHYEYYYCNCRIYTFDGLRVYFPRRQFYHAFFESASRRSKDKSVFSRQRAERMDWIAAALQDGTADLYVGWNSKKKTYAYDRRVTIVYGNYVVVLQVRSDRASATFVTAFVGGPETLRRIRGNPRWTWKQMTAG